MAEIGRGRVAATPRECYPRDWRALGLGNQTTGQAAVRKRFNTPGGGGAEVDYRVRSTDYGLRRGKGVVGEGDYGLQTTDYGFQRAEGKGLCALYSVLRTLKSRAQGLCAL